VGIKQHAYIPSVQKISGTSLTTSYQEMATFDDDLFQLLILNSCNRPIVISLDGGVTDQFELDGDDLILDMRANQIAIARPSIQIKALSEIPTSGSVRISAVENRAGRSYL